MSKKTKPLDFDLEWAEQKYGALVPYTVIQNEEGKSQYVKGFQADPEFARQIARICQEGRLRGLPYIVDSDFVRDAAYKWLTFLSDSVLSGDTDLLDATKAMEAWNAEAQSIRNRRKIEESWADHEYALDAITRSGDWKELLKKLVSIAHYIEQMRVDQWWYTRMAHRLANSQVVRRAVAALQRAGHADTKVVVQMAAWINEYKEEA